MDKSVAVIVSTYNGEKYIREQLDSIIKQTYKNVDIYVRDDNSKDNTMQILKEYEKEKKIIRLKTTKNLGYPEAFYEIMRNIGKYDYYAFSDQDDVWYEDKIERAVKMLNKTNSKKPTLFFANYEVCDENLNLIRKSVGPKEQPKFNYSLFSSVGLGFTYVLNHEAFELVLNNRSKKNVTKDVWIGMLCGAFGTLCFDSKCCAKHRRNPGAYSSQDTSFFTIQKDRFEKFFKGDGFSYVHNVMLEFYEMFGEKLKLEDKKLMEKFIYKGYNPIKRIKKVFHKGRLRYDFKDEIMLRIIFLIGKL